MSHALNTSKRDWLQPPGDPPRKTERNKILRFSHTKMIQNRSNTRRGEHWGSEEAETAESVEHCGWWSSRFWNLLSSSPSKCELHAREGRGLEALENGAAERGRGRVMNKIAITIFHVLRPFIGIACFKGKGRRAEMTRLPFVVLSDASDHLPFSLYLYEFPTPPLFFWPFFSLIW